MKEIVLTNKKNGGLALFLIIVQYLAAIGVTVYSGIMLEETNGGILNVITLVIGLVWLCLGWIPLLGLKILKPQEALVLTLFGKYVGTIKEEGFYYVNPFCSAVNPAANTKLRQSGDVAGSSGFSLAAADSGTKSEVAVPNLDKRISFHTLKML